VTIAAPNTTTGVFRHFIYVYNTPGLAHCLVLALRVTECVGSFLGSNAQVSLYSAAGLVLTLSVENGATPASGVTAGWRYWHTFKYGCMVEVVECSSCAALMLRRARSQ
jgi:hypothetical protein